jgi:hypothetical protein
MEDQAFSPSYDLACLLLSLPMCRLSTVELTGGKGGREGERDGEEPNHTTARMPGPLEIIQYSLQLTIAGMGEGLMRIRKMAEYSCVASLAMSR